MELLLLYSLYVRLIQHTSLFAVQLCLLLHLLDVLLVLVFEINFRLPHGQPALVRQLDQLFCAQHFRLVVEQPASDVFFFFALEPEHFLGLLPCILHFLDGDLFLFLEDLDAILELENILFLLQACPTSLLPASEAFGSLWSGLLG